MQWLIDVWNWWADGPPLLRGMMEGAVIAVVLVVAAVFLVGCGVAKIEDVTRANVDPAWPILRPTIADHHQMVQEGRP